MGSSLFWFENWTGLGALYFTTPTDFVIDETIHNVRDVMQHRQWDEELLRQSLTDELATHIMENCKPPELKDTLDKQLWMLQPNGEFSVKSAWDYVRRRNEPLNAYKKI